MSETPQDTAPRPGGFLFVALFVLLSVLLLSQMGSETKFSAKGNLVAQPRFWPAVGIIMMVVFGALHLILSWKDRVGGAGAEISIWLRAFEYLIWFMIYVAAVPIIGYLAATILFTVLLALRQGYRGTRQLIAAALLGFAIVLVFKTGLSVKIPGGAIYEYLPGAMRNFMIVNF